MDTKDFLEALQVELQTIEKQIESLQAERDEIKRMMARRRGAQMSLVMSQLSATNSPSDDSKWQFPLTMTPALQYLVDKHSGEPMTAMQFRDKLLEMLENKQFKTDIKDLGNVLSVVHQTLNSFANRGIVITKKSGGKVKYVKAVQQ